MSATEGGSPPVGFINVAVANGEEPINATASSSGGWLTVTPYASSAPTVLTVGATMPLAAGSYSGTVSIQSVNSGLQYSVDVNLLVSPRAITAKPTTLSFVQQKRGAIPAAQQVQISANVRSAFTASSQSNWIHVAAPANAATPASITVSVDPTGLPAGVNQGTVVIAGPNTITIPVSLQVADPPVLSASTSSIVFTFSYGDPGPPSQAFTVKTSFDSVGFTAAATTDSGAKWLLLDSTSGTTPATLNARIDTSQLLPGVFSGAITITPADPAMKPISVPVVLKVTGTSVLVRGILNAATYAPGPVSPGELIAITGLGLGPDTGVVARPSAAGAFDVALADVHVSFDGIPAPLLYVQSEQINAIVPYAMAGRTGAKLQVQFGTAYSFLVDVKVTDSAPGIFTAGGTGRGQAAALNADSTPNSAVNPLDRGSVIVVYGTGEGQTDPPGQDGRVIAADLRRPLLQVTAKIGGRPAEVLYAGSASTLVSGVFQANIQVPVDVDVGAVPVELQIGGATSPPGVTIVVR
ncbi:MAG TPA: hypothetical protein VGF59_29375 [Bryobacteraceae bacterium]